MQFRVRRLAPGEVDHELIWLSASVSSLALAASWLSIGLPWPVCIFHEVTGLPCVTCGMTRCAIQFFHGHFATALKWNPLIFTLLSGVIAFDLYALAALTTRVPRLRISFSTPRAKTFLRLSVILVFALNWIYLLSHWRDF
jgi:ribose/xylose/arabinose/galactoside ABC-type transport system permease subunit